MTEEGGRSMETDGDSESTRVATKGGAVSTITLVAVDGGGMGVVVDNAGFVEIAATKLQTPTTKVNLWGCRLKVVGVGLKVGGNLLEDGMNGT